MYTIKKLKKKDYLETIKLIKEIKDTGFIAKNMNEFLNGKKEFVDSMMEMYLNFAEVLGQEQIQKKIDKLLSKTVEDIDLEDLDLDQYIELIFEWVEVQGLANFLKKLFPALNIDLTQISEEA